ncbi:MAG: 4-(cytidine 5'-diphospho)-2-C-methyl-D-erythritol kinase [Bacteroidetes bacterium]|nr:4-(cytidine 5'-diphospho)-2-C-methyl-D-erythritol kinase [Bacteroidota bacterium]
MAKFVKKMLLFPNCKINLGLNIVKKLSNGYHLIETVFYPINWCDILEVNETTNQNKPFNLKQTGLNINGKLEDNILYKSFKLINEIKKLPNLNIHLHKQIPMGAGLGGGSSNAAFFINHLNTTFQLNLTDIELNTIVSKLGADCAFFLNNKPAFAKGIGNEFEPIKLNLKHFYIVLIYPNIHSDTKLAYSKVIPSLPLNDLKNSIETLAINEWKNVISNSFEESIFDHYPKIKEVKDYLYQKNAIYASMSGSGSSVFGIFDYLPDLTFPTNYLTHIQLPNG